MQLFQYFTKYTLLLLLLISFQASSLEQKSLEKQHQVHRKWDVKHHPTPLVNPIKITLPQDITPTLSKAYNATCEGYIYRVIIPRNKDALVIFKGNQPLKYPVLVSGGKNVHIKGLEIVLETQDKCKPHTYTYSNGKVNLHPRAPTTRALGINPLESVYIEGTFIDVNGHDADCIVSNNNNYEKKTDLLHTSKVLIQNSACYGIESAGDVHGDAFQTQGGALKELIFENFSVRQSGEGIVLSYPVAHTILRNFDYQSDPRFDSDDSEDKVTGGAFWDSGKQTPKMTYSFENVYVNYLNPHKTGWFYVAGHHFISKKNSGEIRYGVKTEHHPEIHFNKRSPDGDPAPKIHLGRNYKRY